MPDPLPEDLAAAVTGAFPEVERARALAVLQSVDGDRCSVAVLVLATDGAPSLNQLEEFARVAALDYRDALYWAEYSPERLDYPAALARLGLKRPHPV